MSEEVLEEEAEVVVEVTTKVCGKCRKELPLDMFTVEKRKSDGRGVWCRRCKAAHQLERVRLLRSDPAWVAERAARTKLNRLISAGTVVRPTSCPVCGVTPSSPREMNAAFSNERDPTSARWRCRSCALTEAGKSLTVSCRWCSEPFVTQVNLVRSGGARYCSTACRSAWMKKTGEHVKKVPLSQRSRADTIFLEDRFTHDD